MQGASMARFKRVMAFLILWLIAQIFWTFLIRGFTAHHADNAAAQGLAANTIA